MSGTHYFTKYVGSTPEDRLKLKTVIYFYPRRIYFLNLKNTNPKSSIFVEYVP